MPKKRQEPKTRSMAVYSRDYETFAKLARSTDRSLVHMFQHVMNQIREGKPIPYVAESNGEKANV